MEESTDEKDRREALAELFGEQTEEEDEPGEDGPALAEEEGVVSLPSALPPAEEGVEGEVELEDLPAAETDFIRGDIPSKRLPH